MTDFAQTIASALLDCLCTQAALISTPPQHCRLGVGDEQAHDAGGFVDLCCEGLAYVALGETYPSSESFPEQDIVRQTNGSCYPPAWGQRYRVGIVRCAPVTSDSGMTPPTDAQWTAAALLNLEDAAALRRTACCFRAWMLGQTGPLLGMSVVIERQLQLTPAGGCVERYMTVAAQFPNCDCA